MAATYVLAAVLALAACALSVPCGSWTMGCNAYVNGTSIHGSAQFNGLNAGDFTWNRTVFQGSVCTSVPILTILMAGSWIDMEFNNASSPNRWMYFDLSSLIVTPGSAAQATYLQTACPCGGTWASGVARSLSACNNGQAGVCPDTTWLGGTPLNASIPAIESIIIGRPFYGQILSPTWGTSGNLQFSLLDANDLIGWNNPFLITGNAYAGSACIGPLTSSNVCGTYQQYCSPAFPGRDYLGITSQFAYTGTTPTSGFITPDAGVYTYTETMFGDTACTDPFIIVNHEGTFGYVNTSAPMPGAYIIERNTPGVTVTPMHALAAVYLNQSCPCGGGWFTGKSRLLTVCDATCDTSQFYHGATVGSPNYATMNVVASAAYSEVRFTEYSNNRFAVPNVFSAASYPYEMTSPCAFNFGGNNFCGIWHQPCGVFGNGAFDMIKLLTVQGDIYSGSGRFIRERSYYQPGAACGNELMQIVENGYWGSDGFSPVTPGGYELTVNIPSSNVTVFDATQVALLNANCPCGGTWAVGVPRVLTSCPLNCNSSLFLAGDLGVPGFGTWRRYPNELRISTLQTDSVSGFNTPLAINDFPYIDVSFCPVETNNTVYCGTYYLPCLTDSLISKDVTGTIQINEDESITIQRSIYKVGTGCPAGVSPIMNITITGLFAACDASNVITGASEALIGGSTITVTPLTPFGEQYLQSACPCNQTWVVGQATVLTSCSSDSCPDSNWLRYPIANNAWGNVLQEGDQLRLSRFQATAADGYATAFSAFDYYYTQQSTCTREEEYTCEGFAENIESNGITGGDIFLIILFAIIGTYLIVATAYGYFKNRKLEVPNKSTWIYVGGLIASGVRFSFVEVFGLRKVKAGYTAAALDGGLKESYGTL